MISRILGTDQKRIFFTQKMSIVSCGGRRSLNLVLWSFIKCLRLFLLYSAFVAALTVIVVPDDMDVLPTLKVVRFVCASNPKLASDVI